MPGIGGMVVVDDGSGPGYRSLFIALSRVPGVYLLTHAQNQGKGAALKTGLQFTARQFPQSVGAVTADADGQHAAADVAHIAQELVQSPKALVIGARTMAPEAPWRSRFGNRLTRWLMKRVTGQRITDTQTGLRGIPRGYVPELLEMPETHYDFELDMLVHCRESGRTIREVPIATIYIDENRGSHFHPVQDSVRVYLVLLRYASLSLVTAALDNTLFIVALQFWPYISLCQAMSRITAGSFQFWAVKRGVFRSHAPVGPAMAKFWLCSAATGGSSYLIIRLLLHYTTIDVVPAKLLAETLMFFVSFAVQREVVFAHREQR